MSNTAMTRIKTYTADTKAELFQKLNALEELGEMYLIEKQIHHKTSTFVPEIKSFHYSWPITVLEKGSLQGQGGTEDRRYRG